MTISTHNMNNTVYVVSTVESRRDDIRRVSVHTSLETAKFAAFCDYCECFEISPDDEPPIELVSMTTGEDGLEDMTVSVGGMQYFIEVYSMFS